MRRSGTRRRRAYAATAAVVAAVLSIPGAATPPARTATGRPVADVGPGRTTPYPVGVFDLNEPSLLAPPGPGSVPGYHTLFADDFRAKLVYDLWGIFNGVPKGDRVGRFETSHVFVRRGLLRIGTWRDRTHDGAWASGGVCLCGVHPEYGIFLVRSRETAPGPDVAEMLFPSDGSWPPEVDFAETGVATDAAGYFDHYRPAPAAVWGFSRVDVLHWHTWGIAWTPTRLAMLLDGRARAVVTRPAAIPHLPMELDLQQETWCGIYPECPRRPAALLVDWVEVYVPNPG